MNKISVSNSQRKLGAFYTPFEYAKKALELVRKAISLVPQGNDYIILDRCAGTGNLEYFMTDEELSHCILNTYDLEEWKILNSNYKDRVRLVIPLNKTDSGYSGYNALSESFIVNSEIQKYIDNPNCNIILLENPPYSDDSADAPFGKGSRGNTKDNYLVSIMNKELSSSFKGLVQSKDICNLFIWSGFKYYLRNENDFYILLAPLKYWKTGHLVNKKFLKGYAFNRKHFQAGPSVVGCILWQNKDENIDKIQLEAFDIINGRIEYIKNLTVYKVYKTVNEYLFDKRVFDDDTEDGIYSASSGLEGEKKSSTSTVPIYNKNIVGYLYLTGLSLERKHLFLTRNTLNYRKNGFYLREDNFIEKLPLFCAKSYPQNKWYETDVYSTVADKLDEYTKDKEFLKRCLIFTCLSIRNKCRSLYGSDGRFYRNELCLYSESKAGLMLKEFVRNGCCLLGIEKDLICSYNEILCEISKKDSNGNYIYSEYKDEYWYGIYQIEDEINVNMDKSIKKYPLLNEMLCKLKSLLKVYYSEYIERSLFEYELLK